MRELREDAQLTQEELANTAGLGTTYYGRVERGEINVCLGTQVSLARALGVRLGELFTWDEP